jgi:hypothetical protein
MSDWYPGAIRVPYAGSGPHTPGTGHRITMHTTEGFGLPVYNGSNPHFTIDPKTGRVWQHTPLSQGAKALVHGFVDTNHCHNIQIEQIGFAAHTSEWTDGMYANVKELTDWICAQFDVPKKIWRDWKIGTPRMSGSTWLAFSGFTEHAQVPGNVHWDCGNYNQGKLLGPGGGGGDRDLCDGAGRLYERGDSAGAVEMIQHWLNKVGDKSDHIVEDGDFGAATELRVKQFQSNRNRKGEFDPDHHLDVDGVVGPATWHAMCLAARAA